MKKLIALAFAALIQACAFTDATLDVQHDPSISFEGPISEAPSTRFLPATLEDNRSDKARIGWKKNGFGQNTADMTTAEPVTTIISDAIETGLSQNGHHIVEDGRVKIEGSVDRFWFETDQNFWTIEFIGDVQCSLAFIDTRTGEVFYQSTYSGSHSEKKGGGLSGTWEAIMSQAVNKLIEDITFDEDLMMALEALHEGG
ncbi:YajG family lipoprotein [Marinimicrobium agarilyticum]|uniref:YajG family lipoprotein n=1 Tax=Marinimicrobium agarilyticum TaxID=306546 RepID=UPI0004249495|nr:YajG family lipoprotein [Marinimicrobium agarilyticum]